MNSIFAEKGDIALDSPFRPHLTIHRGSQQHRTCEGEIQGREQIVGHAAGKPGECRRSGWCNDEEFSASREADVFSKAVLFRLKSLPVDRSVGQGFKGGGTDEFPRRGRHHDRDLRSCLHKPTAEVCRLVGCNPSSHTEKNLPSGQCVHDRLANIVESWPCIVARGLRSNLSIDNEPS